MIASEIRCDLGEGPLWHPALRQLYVTDAFCGAVTVFDQRLRALQTIENGTTTTALTWQRDGSVLQFHDRGAITRLAASGERQTLLECLPDEREGLFNDVIADPEGRVLAGAQPVGDRPGRLYSIEPDLSHRVLLDDVGEPNGLAFSPDQNTLYFNDSVKQTIWQFRYDCSTGGLSDRRALFSTTGSVLPDGVTVDDEGFLWSALWDGGCVIRIDPQGHIVRTVALPVRRVTSLTFGGPTFETLFVTSARRGAGQDSDKASLDGAVFAFENLGRGLPEHPSALGLPRSSSTLRS